MNDPLAPFTDLRWDGCSSPSILLRRVVSLGTWNQICSVRHLPVDWPAVIDAPSTWIPLSTRQACLLAHLAGLTHDQTVEKLQLCRGDAPSAKEQVRRLAGMAKQESP